MSGIAGWMTCDGAQPSTESLGAMLKALAHRGPDGEGLFHGPGLSFGLTRLSIFDPIARTQPFLGPNGSALVCNGEIYNHGELRSLLSGVRLSTPSDCELPLHLYDIHKLHFANQLRGMYAIALFDAVEGNLLLSRDPFGIKPLYYAEVPGGLVFASEAQAILATGAIRRAPRSEAITELLQLQFNTGRETIFAGIKRVLPGETLVVRRGRIVDRYRRAALPDREPETIGEAEALARLDSALMNSVGEHQRADVPVGMFLSGGIDSAAVLACMARGGRNGVRAYTAAFGDAGGDDELAHARTLARSVGAEHTEVRIGMTQFLEWLPRIVASIDDPAADYAIIPTYLLAREAAREVKVVLCGDGADELFAGYGRYRSMLRPLWFGGRTMRGRGLVESAGVLRDRGPAWRDGFVAVERRLAEAKGSRLQKAQALDCADWLPNDVLIKLDRCLMAHALEGRTPFLDPAITAASYCLPDDMKISRGVGKYLLRTWLGKAMPVADAFDRKRGFTVPVGDWMAPHAIALGPLVARVPGVAMSCVPERVEALFRSLGRSPDKHATSACWLLLFFALWYRIHVEGASPLGDIMSTLESR